MDGMTELQKQVDSAVRSQLRIVLTLPNPDKSRCLLCLAYEYFIQDMEEDAFNLLSQADPEYFKDQLAKDMKEIENMETIVTSVLQKLIEAGYIKVSAK
jgi:hypothetical protein